MQDDESRVRGFIAKVTGNDWDGATALFDDTMRAALPKEKLAAVWHSVEERAGAFKRIDSLELKPKGDLRIGLAQASFERAPLVFRVVLGADGRVTGFFIAPGDTASRWQAPSYANLESFDSERVVIGSSPGLPGVLTMPKSGKPCPAVVLVHGSGPNDEDETLGALKPFKDLAFGLASRGVAVLRYEKRTRVDGAGVRTQKEEVEDAAHAAVAFLRKRTDVDPARILLLGHSQGGYLAPRMAKSDDTIKGLVIFAGSTRSLEDSILGQFRYLATLQPGEPKLKDAIAEAERFKAAVESSTLKADDQIKTPLGPSISGAYFLDVRGYHPETIASRLAIPMLVLQGERDYQVTVVDDFPAWKSALAHKQNATLKTYPRLNHAFTAGDAPPSPADYEKPGHVEDEVIADIASFATNLH
jgi:uncharacterized protein